VSDENDKFQYSYQYDNHGNWVELTVNRSSCPVSVNRRKLAYY